MPKDGPSAGAAMVTAIVSALSGRSVSREVAMTGEITLTGEVLAIGGLKEKTMAAAAAGVKTVLIPVDNMKDIPELDPEAVAALRILPCRQLSEVLAEALAPVPAPAEKPREKAVTAPEEWIIPEQQKTNRGGKRYGI